MYSHEGDIKGTCMYIYFGYMECNYAYACNYFITIAIIYCSSLTITITNVNFLQPTINQDERELYI